MILKALVVILLLFFSRGKVAVFSILCEKYQASISRDPSYREVSNNAHTHPVPVHTICTQTQCQAFAEWAKEWVRRQLTAEDTNSSCLNDWKCIKSAKKGLILGYERVRKVNTKFLDISYRYQEMNYSPFKPNKLSHLRKYKHN